MFDPDRAESISPINITIRAGRGEILFALGNDFTGFGGKGYVNNASQILSRLQSLIHKHAPMSKYDVERGGGTFTEEMARIAT